MKKLVKPKIKQTIPSKLEEVLKEEEWYQKSFEKEDYPSSLVEVSEWNECIFKNISFEIANLKEIGVMDTIFEHCDFSNGNFENQAFYRVEFHSCKFVGTEFLKVNFYDCLFEDCNLEYSNLADCKTKTCEFTDCRFQESRFHSNQFSVTEWNHCDFSNLELIETSMEKQDVSTCNLTGLRADSNYLKGMIIAREQAMDLISLFEIEIRS